MNDYSPWTAVARLQDVLVAFADLPSGRGWWEPDEKVLLLDRRQSRREMRCTLAHELEHIMRGDCDVSTASPILHARQEVAACAAAARRLIPMARLIDALLWSQDEHELAEELNVDLDTLQVRLLTLTPDEHALIDDRLWSAEGQIA
jgi:Zn-dependent peptidase ImmA (M78 family)